MWKRYEAALLLAGIALFWGINWPAMKLVLAEIPIWTFRVACLTVGSATLFAIARLSGHRMEIDRDRLPAMVATAFLNVTGWHLLSAYGLTQVEAGRSAIVAYSMPLWASVLAALFLKEPFGLRRALALAIGLGGLSLLVLPDLDALAAAPLGVAAMFLGAFSWAAGTVAARGVDWRMPTTSFVAWQLAIGGLPILAGMLVFDPWPPSFALSAPVALIFLYVLTLPMGFGQWAYFRVVAITSAGTAAFGTLATPVVGVVSSSVLLGDRFGWTEIGALLGVTGALLLLATESRKENVNQARIVSRP